MKTAYIPLAIMLTIMVACKKESVPVPLQSQTVAKEFDSCNCSDVQEKEGDSEYIKADIDGVSVCFDQLPALGDTFPNILMHGVILRDTGNQYYDNLSMIRNARNSHWQAAMFLKILMP